ncbi:MAG: helix-turn-helix transcriptional regulator [Firmicutes bacterium]|nr:helix-turn-helix transcriptional regulator [Bacillota bacterium]
MGGDALRSLRESLRITADDLGALLGYTGSAIRNWETGHRKPDVTDLQRMAEFFEIDIDDLLAARTCTPPAIRLARWASR